MSKLKKKDIIILIILLIIFIIIVIAIFKLITTDNEDTKTTTTKETSTTTKTIKETNVKLTLVGDFLFESPIYKAHDSGEDLNNYFKRIRAYFNQDDITIGNMEVPISDGSLTISGDGFNFCAPKYIGDLVNTLDLQVLSTANNHTYDRNVDGIKSTINYFKNNTGIMTVGTNDDGNFEEKILTVNNIRIGFLSYTYGTNQKPLPEKRKYISY